MCVFILMSKGSCVGDEFWSYPQRYGDEMSGIETTLTQREKGRWEPVTHVGQPRRICQESGTHIHDNSPCPNFSL